MLAFIQAVPSGGDSGGAFGFPTTAPIDFLSPVLADLAKGGAALVTAMEQWPIYTTTAPKLTYENGAVLRLLGDLRLGMGAALAVVVALVGLTLILRSHRGQSSEDIRELVPRLVLGTALLAGCQLLTQEAIDLNNALCDALSVGDIADLMPVHVEDVGTALLLLIFVLAYLAVNFLLLFSMVGRLVGLDALLVLAPLAAVLWILPQTQGYARLWLKLFVSLTFAQFLMLVSLRLATLLPSSFGQGGTASAIAGVVVGIAELWFARQMLTALANEGFSGGGGTGAGMALAAAGLLLRMRGGGGAAAAAGGTQITPSWSPSPGAIGGQWGSLASPARAAALSTSVRAPAALPAAQRALPAPRSARA